MNEAYPTRRRTQQQQDQEGNCRWRAHDSSFAQHGGPIGLRGSCEGKEDLCPIRSLNSQPGSAVRSVTVPAPLTRPPPQEDEAVAYAPCGSAEGW